MSELDTDTGDGWLDESGAPRASTPRPALVILWSMAEPHRVGEVAWLQGAQVLGRGGSGAARVGFGVPPSPLDATGISREHLKLELEGLKLRVTCVGRAPLKVLGQPRDEATLEPGQLFSIDKQLVLLFCQRELHPRDVSGLTVPFGLADAWGTVGESPAAWKLRRQLAFAAKTTAHVLLLGATGSGKELAARAIHVASPNGSRTLVSRNAATLPPGLIDAELFGNARNYPHQGMPERAGLVGEAHRSTLFLDELGDLPESSQVHLLRVLDPHGEYQRLGEATVRTADFRLVAATNRPVSELRQDLLARFALRIEVPPLSERREDIPLLARHLLTKLARADDSLGTRFFERWNGKTGEPRLEPELLSALVSHAYTQGTRELESLLLTAIANSPGHFLALTAAVSERLKTSVAVPAREAPLTVEDIEAALARNDGNVSRSWQELGLSSRDALNRLMKKLGM